MSVVSNEDKIVWANGSMGNTPLSAENLNKINNKTAEAIDTLETNLETNFNNSLENKSYIKKYDNGSVVTSVECKNNKVEHHGVMEVYDNINIHPDKKILVEKIDTHTGIPVTAKVTGAVNADIATYASADTSKGTIEERLTSLGFKYGGIAFTGATAEETDSVFFANTTNIIKKCGKLVYVQWIWAALDNAPFRGTFQIPSAFLPTNNSSFTIQNAVNYAIFNGGGTTNNLTINANGTFTLPSESNVIRIVMSFSYEIEPIVASSIPFSITVSFLAKRQCAIDGMTWGEWIESMYNNDGFTVSGNNIIYVTQQGTTYTVKYNNTNVNTSDIIVSGRDYRASN